ncbi:hypothetical protein LshimejAT787_0800430 [Lyophyllum shimeji]|uniref:Uncharacterized protein n=1 Tax=Lyophyllum shimeji TaxID=47721 RepID=A0A9P3PRR1_LYOSH|nr:hypothetical protein LshimejAT787_0800430 [Lyophyllum shimeji]
MLSSVPRCSGTPSTSSSHLGRETGIPEVLYLLTPHANRWHRISISIARGSADDIYAPFSSVAAPALIHLSLRIGRCDDDDDSPRTEYPDTCPPIITRGSPALTFVRVAGKVVGNLTPPLSAVKTFHVDAWPKNLMTLSQFRAMLEALPCLVHLSLTGLSIHLPRNPLDISEPVPLPSLRSLRIRGNSVPCHRLLSLLTLPALESLSLHNVDTFDSAVIPTVKSLTLEACDFTESELRNMFRSFPDISTLNIDASVPRIYPMLRPDAGQDPPWPQLRSIYLRQLPPADVVPFCLLVLGRVGTDAAVSSVYLDKRSRSVLNAKDFMEILRDQLLVGNCDYLPQWPADLGYEDPDDDWDWDYMR